jgi:hypothetical protein
MKNQLCAAVCPVVLGVFMPMCPAPAVQPTAPPDRIDVSELWTPPVDLAAADLFYGPWGVDYAPDARDVYRFLKPKTSGANPGMTVEDPHGRKWSVKQPNHDRKRRPEGPIEVIVSRILSAVGYHQPPVYYLPSFLLRDDFGARVETGGRFRLDHDALKERGTWSWQQNPFVGTRPYNGLLAILMMLNSSDLKNDNNSLYEYRAGERVQRWFVVRDLGIGLGATGTVLPPRGDIEAFAAHGFITGVENGFVVFDYRGYHEELLTGRITVEDVRWAGDLLAQLSDRQWRDAFRAGGYDEALAGRFIRKLQSKIADARALGAGPATEQ